MRLLIVTSRSPSAWSATTCQCGWPEATTSSSIASEAAVAASTSRIDASASTSSSGASWAFATHSASETLAAAAALRSGADELPRRPTRRWRARDINRRRRSDDWSVVRARCRLIDRRRCRLVGRRDGCCSEAGLAGAGGAFGGCVVGIVSGAGALAGVVLLRWRRAPGRGDGYGVRIDWRAPSHSDRRSRAHPLGVGRGVGGGQADARARRDASRRAPRRCQRMPGYRCRPCALRVSARRAPARGADASGSAGSRGRRRGGADRASAT